MKEMREEGYVWTGEPIAPVPLPFLTPCAPKPRDKRKSPLSREHPIGKPVVDVSFRTDLTVEQMAPSWQELESRAQQSFFLSWAWVGCWLRQTGARPNWLVATRGERLVGLALLQPGKSNTFPYLSGRYLTASGRPDFDSVFIEYNDLLAEPHERPAVRQAFRDFLSLPQSAARPFGGWSRLHLAGATDEMRASWTDERFVVRAETVRSAPFIELKDVRKSGTTYLGTRSANCRQQIRRSMRLFEIYGDLRLEEAHSIEEARSIFDDMKRMHQIGWQARGKPGAFAVPFFEQFHSALLEEAWPAGRIDLLRLRAGSKMIGCLYNFLFRGDAYAYQSGFVTASDPRQKPGLMMHAMAAERYASAGLDRYLLLAGESRYKTSLATGAEILHWLVIRKRGMRGMAEELAEKGGRKFTALTSSMAARQRRGRQRLSVPKAAQLSGETRP
jgi:CelD/BcsL family acetyltransferase involved in cellulose biosynthesis